MAISNIEATSLMLELIQGESDPIRIAAMREILALLSEPIPTIVPRYKTYNSLVAYDVGEYLVEGRVIDALFEEYKNNTDFMMVFLRSITKNYDKCRGMWVFRSHLTIADNTIKFELRDIERSMDDDV